MNERPLTDCAAIVTGGGGTIGAATAAVLLDAGAAVTITSRNADRLQAIAQRLGGANAPVLPVAADATDPGQFDAVVERTLGAYGRIDVLVNLAGAIAPMGVPAWEIEPEAWRRSLDVNLTGAFVTTRAVVPVMLSQGEGRVLHLSSAAAEMPFAGASAYGAAKAAVNQFVRAIAAELDGTGVTVVAFNPGPADGPALREVRAALFPQRLAWPGPLARRDAAEAARFILGLCDAASASHNGEFVSWRDLTYQ
jgi:3-hydroxybutyrate dehydrogenase